LQEWLEGMEMTLDALWAERAVEGMAERSSKNAEFHNLYIKT